MLKLIRVILSAQVDGFIGGMSRAGQALRSFVSSVQHGMGQVKVSFTEIKSAIELLKGAFNWLKGAFDNTLGGLIRNAAGIDRWRRAMTAVVGDAQKVADIEQMLTDKTLALGGSMSEARFASQQLAFGLQAMTGEVDAGQLEELIDLMMTIQAARPDIIGGTQAIGRGLAAAMAGDFTTLTRLLDLPLNKIQEILGLQEDVGLNAEQQLGAVTRLGMSAAQSVGDPIAAIRAILEQAGIDAEFLEAVTQGPAADIDRLAAAWEHLKEVAAVAFLPSLIEGMTKLAALVEENRPELEKFAAKWGEIAGLTFEGLIDFVTSVPWDQVIEDANNAAQAVKEFLLNEENQQAAKDFADDILKITKNIRDFVVDPKTGETIENIALAMGNIATLSFTELSEAFNSVKWAEIRDLINDIAKAYSDFKTLQMAHEFAARQAAPFGGITNPVGWGVYMAAMNQGLNDPALQATANRDTSGNAPRDTTAPPPMAAPMSNMSAGGAVPGGVPQNIVVDLKLSFDENGSLVPVTTRIAREQASEVIGELVAAASGGGSGTGRAARLNTR